MRLSKIELRKKIIAILKDNPEHQTTEKLATACRCSHYCIRSAIRSIREGKDNIPPVGIHSLRAGHILSEFASMRDDVALMHRMNGLRTMLFMTAYTAALHIEKRWGSIEHKRAYDIIMKPILNSSDDILNRGKKMLIDVSKQLTIK